ncbi:hypothetical protein G9A89_012501 [Geosiphon pyriformis]|nr:hypothetical protein G9A89_012501 [Geosiphon pyriformis]
MSEQHGENKKVEHVSLEQVQEKIENSLSNSNVNVHNFAPDASPEEKAQQVAAQTSKSLANFDSPSAPKAVPTDIDASTHIILDSIQLPGSIGISSAAEVPTWARIGWERVLHQEETSELEYFDQILSEMYFGQLWLNASVVFVAIFTTWLVTVLGFGLGWILIIAAFVATYFKNSVKRFHRNARSDIKRELSKERLETDEESTEWLNEFMRRFWLIYEPVLSASIVQSVDAVLAASTPSFLDSIRLSTFTLGTKSPYIESVKSYPKTDDDIVVMDWKLAFEPNDLANMTRQQIKNKVNPKIVLAIRLGRGIVGADVPILLEDISFSGKIQIKLKLMNVYPHVQTVWLSFLEEPKIDFILKPIGGDFGFDIANMPGLSNFIHEQVHGSLRPMMYAPNSYELNMEYMLSGVPLDAAIGVLKITIYNAKGLKNVEKFGTPDPYIKLLLNGRPEITRTKVIQDSLNPHWNETHNIVLTNLQENLNLQLWDKNATKDKSLGMATFECIALKEQPSQEQVVAPIILDGKEHGTLRFDAMWYPVAPQGPEDPVVESNSGILRLTIHQAKDLDAKHSLVGQYNPYAELNYNGANILTTKIKKRTNNPVWEEFKEIFVTDKSAGNLLVQVKDSRDFAEDPVVAIWKSNLPDFIKALEKNDWFNVVNAASGKLRLSCQWRPILLDYTPSHTGYAEPIGVIKLTIKKATDLKNADKLGKSDPYARVCLGPQIRGRTEVQSNNLNPVWNSIHYVPVHSLKEILTIEIFDYDNAGKHKLLGHTDLLVNKLVKKKDDKTYEAIENIDTNAVLTVGRDQRGKIYYSAVFYPSLVAKKEEEKISKEGDKTTNTSVAKQEGIDVLNYQSGILVININKATIEKKNIYAQLLVDDMVYPFFKTASAKENNPTIHEATDVFIKELDFSKLTINIKQEDRKEPLGTITTGVKNLLRAPKGDGIWLPLDDNPEAKLNVDVHYIPTPAKIEAFESINDMGKLQVTLKDAKNLPAADRSGTSDPYITFSLNGNLVFKSKTVKKDLNPTFDESFEFIVPSRTASKFTFEVFDWNQMSSHSKLGDGTIDLSSLEPNERFQQSYPLSNGKGSIQVFLLFRPDFVTRLGKKNSSTFSSATRALTNIGSSTVTGVGENIMKTGAGVAGVVGGGANLVGAGVVGGANLVGAGASLVGSGFGFLGGKGSKKTNESTPIDPPVLETSKVTPYSLNSAKQESPSQTLYQSPNTDTTEVKRQVVTPVEEKENGIKKEQPAGISPIFGNSRRLFVANTEPISEQGTLTVHIIEAKGLKATDRGGTSDPFVKVFWGKKEMHKTQTVKKTISPSWKETFTIPNLNGDQVLLKFQIKDHNRLGTNPELGDVDIRVWDHINSGNYNADIWQKVNGGGELHLQLEFSPGSDRNSSDGSVKPEMGRRERRNEEVG